MSAPPTSSNTLKNSKNSPVSKTGSGEPSGSTGVAGHSSKKPAEQSRRYGTASAPGLEFSSEAGPSGVVVIGSPSRRMPLVTALHGTHRGVSQHPSGGSGNMVGGPKGMGVPGVHNSANSASPYNRPGLLPTAMNLLKGNLKNHQSSKNHHNKATYTRRLSPHPNSAALNCRLEGSLCADFTLDGSGAAQQRKQSMAQARHRKCCCWMLVFLALGVFIAVMVAVSWYITGGKRVFGPM